MWPSLRKRARIFQGAMYVSYALGVALSVGVLLVNLLFGFNVIWYFVSNTLALFLMAPFLFRWARALYMNIFISYRKDLDHSAKLSDSKVHRSGV